MYERTCEEYVGLEPDEETKRILKQWDRDRAAAAAKATTAEAKETRSAKKARKTQLLLRKALRAGAYTYITSDERAAKIERGSDGENESDNEESNPETE